MNNQDNQNYYPNYPNNSQPYFNGYPQAPKPKVKKHAYTKAVGGWTDVAKALVYMMIIGLIIAGAVIGGGIDDEIGWVLGIIIGAIVGVLSATFIMVIIEISQNMRSVLIELQELNKKL